MTEGLCRSVVPSDRLELILVAPWGVLGVAAALDDTAHTCMGWSYGDYIAEDSLAKLLLQCV